MATCFEILYRWIDPPRRHSSTNTPKMTEMMPSSNTPELCNISEMHLNEFTYQPGCDELLEGQPSSSELLDHQPKHAELLENQPTPADLLHNISF